MKRGRNGGSMESGRNGASMKKGRNSDFDWDESWNKFVLLQQRVKERNTALKEKHRQWSLRLQQGADAPEKHMDRLEREERDALLSDIMKHTHELRRAREAANVEYRKLSNQSLRDRDDMRKALSDLQDQVLSLRTEPEEVVLKQIALNIEMEIKNTIILTFAAERRQEFYYASNDRNEMAFRDLDIEAEVDKCSDLRDEVLREHFAGDFIAYQDLLGVMKFMKKYPRRGIKPTTLNGKEVTYEMAIDLIDRSQVDGFDSIAKETAKRYATRMKDRKPFLQLCR